MWIMWADNISGQYVWTIKGVKMTDAITEIRKLFKEDKLIYGKDTTVKGLKRGEIAKVFLSSNCSKETSDDIKHYGAISEVEIVDLDIPNDELKDVCKKPFNIQVLGVKK